MSGSGRVGDEQAIVQRPGVSIGASQPRGWHLLDLAALEQVLNTNHDGLSDEEIASRLDEHGPNQLEDTPPPTLLELLLRQFKSPLIYILLVAAVIMLLVGDLVDAGVIAAVLLLNAAIGLVQERRAESSVRALMQLTSPRARVVRGGRTREIESRELVPGDLVLLESGIRVPADLRLASATTLAIDESLLTGESQPSAKRAGALDDPELPLADRRNLAYMGTVVTSGRGRGYVVATAGRTELGAIALRVRTEERLETPLQQRMTRFAHIIAIAVAASSAAAFAVGLVMGRTMEEMFVAAVALAVAAIPEGLPVVFTVTLALGVRRMSRRNAIVRRLPAVETLGSTTVIGSDKTGTLTENRMTVQQVWAAGRTHAVRREGRADAADVSSQALRLTLLAGVLTNEAHVALQDDRIVPTGDPTDVALLISASIMGVDPGRARSTWHTLAEIPFEPDRRYSASFREQDGRVQVFVKGAPERILEMCADMLGPSGRAALDRPAVLDAAHEMAAQGLRVLAMAWRRLPAAPSADDPELPSDLTLVGLQGMMDPPREGVAEAIRGCQHAGLRVVMITGDHAETARAIARDLGIAPAEAPVLTGVEIERMDDAALSRRVADVSVYARVSPEHKLRVVRACQALGETVAVTGDGVNDAPALKAADIGIAMGRSGTDVARESADMVLADDNFVSIYAAVEEGRVTFDNVRKVTFFLVSTGAAAILAVLGALSLGWPLPMVAAQLLWLNLVTKGLQDLALAFEPGEAGVLDRPPRPVTEGIVSALLWERTAIVGVVMAAGTLYMFNRELDWTDVDGTLRHAQTVALTTMVLFQAFHVGNSRSEHQSVFRKSPFSNPFLFVSQTAALLVHVAALYLPVTQFVLRVEPLELAVWRDMIVVALTIIVAMELHKLIRRPARS
jgi:calcium-translocating P-type ATPase